MASYADPADVVALERVPLDQRVSARTTLELIAASANTYPSRPALVYEKLPGRVVVVTYEELVTRIASAAGLFAELADGSDSVVAYMLPNDIETHVVIWGAEGSGIACAVNPLLEPEHIAGIVRAAGAVTLVAWGEGEIWRKALHVRRQVPSIRNLVRVGGTSSGEGEIDYWSALAGVSVDASALAASGTDDIAAYFPTGGTTGLPKLVRHTHGNEIAAATVGSLSFGVGPDDVVISGMPLFHAAGVVFGLIALSQGATLVLVGEEGFRSRWVLEGGFWDTARRHRATVFPVVPTALAGLLASWSPSRDANSLRHAVCGASALPSGLHSEFERTTGVRVLPCYALTEATLTVTVAARDGKGTVGSAGIRAPYVELAIVDRSTNADRTCDIGEVGSIAVRGRCLFPGYLDVRHGEGAWLDAGWFDTGDLGRIDGEGQLWVTGRAKDLIIRGGHNIDPLIIEEPLAGHPAVSLVAAVGRPDQYAGEVPVAYLTLKPNSDVAIGELERHAAETIPERAAVPKEIIVLDSLPLTGMGKVFKPTLRQDAARRAVESVIAELGATAIVTVDEDPVRGLVARVALPMDANIDDGGLRRALGRLPMSFELEYMTLA